MCKPETNSYSLVLFYLTIITRCLLCNCIEHSCYIVDIWWYLLTLSPSLSLYIYMYIYIIYIYIIYIYYIYILYIYIYIYIYTRKLAKTLYYRKLCITFTDTRFSVIYSMCVRELHIFALSLVFNTKTFHMKRVC